MPIRWRKDERGQALVEMALVLPILLFLVLGMMEFGRISQAYLTVTHAAREGARAAAVGATDTQVVETVWAAAVSLPPADMQITVDPVDGSRQRGQPVQVSVRFHVIVTAPVIRELLPDPLWVQGVTSMRVE